MKKLLTTALISICLIPSLIASDNDPLAAIKSMHMGTKSQTMGIRALKPIIPNPNDSADLAWLKAGVAAHRESDILALRHFSEGTQKLIVIALEKINKENM